LASGIGTTPESMLSGPLNMGSRSQRSSTYRAIGPTWLRGSVSPPPSAYPPVLGTRPVVGLRAAIPQKWAGRRMLPPESLPMPIGDPPAAMIAASPLLLPPGDR